MLSMIARPHVMMLLPLVGIVVYLVFMFIKGWYSQTLMALAAIGSLATTGLGIHRVRAFPSDWSGPVLLIAGLFLLVFIAITARNLFAKKA